MPFPGLNAGAAAAYAERHTLHALVVVQDGEQVFERFGGGYDAAKPHALYSGTKSFWGPAALAAQMDGILTLDERVAQTVPEWGDDPGKARVTVRELLNLTSGFGFGGMGSAVPAGPAALAFPLKNEPGERFTYGGIPLQVFGEVLRRKLVPRSPHEYLRERIFAPIGLHVGSWRTLKDGTRPLPTGAFLAAQEWLKYGAFLLARRTELTPCFEGSGANPRYGLGFWLRPLPQPDDIFYASGSGGQALYVIPSHRTVVVHFGASSSWRHETFLKRLLSG